MAAPSVKPQPLPRNVETSSGSQWAMQEIARHVLRHDPAIQLPTAQEFQQTLRVGAGTVQKAFALLEATSALDTRSHGHQGRFITERDLGRLWSIAGLPPVEAIMTPPGALEVYGLTDALETEFARLGVPLDIRYLRGASARLDRLKSTAMGFAVLSMGAWRSQVPEASGEVEFSEYPLGEGTYYADGSIIELSRPGVDITDPDTLIGVDHTSFDHVALSRAHFGPLEVRRTVNVAFTIAPAALLHHQIDAAIWHRMLLLITPGMAGLIERPLSPMAADSLAPLARAVLVTRRENPYLRTVFNALSVDRITTSQAEAMHRASLDDGSTWYR